MLSSFGSKTFQRWSYVHSICCSRDKWVTSDPVEGNGNNLTKTKMKANFKSNLIIVCYFKGENKSLGHLWPSDNKRI